MDDILGSVRSAVSHSDIEILAEALHWVEITVGRDEGKVEDLTPPTQSLESPHLLNVYNSDWHIKYWNGDETVGAVMSASSGNNLYFNSTAEFDGSNLENASFTAISMVHYAKIKRWPAIIIMDGNKFMKWVIWAACQEYDIKCIGYEPDEGDLARRNRCSDMLSAFKSKESLAYDFAPVKLGGGSEAHDISDGE